MTAAVDFIAACRADIGYMETPVNHNKFSAALHRPPEAWCHDFLVAKADEVGLHLPDGVHGTAYTWTGLGVWQQVERSPAVPAPGDWTYFRIGQGHVGVLVEFTASTVTTIDGNTIPDGQTGDQANGGEVCLKTRSRALVAGFGRPDYTTPLPDGQDWMTMVFKDEADAREYFVRKTYADELGREPSGDELAAGIFATGVNGFSPVYTKIRDSDEAVAHRAARP